MVYWRRKDGDTMANHYTPILLAAAYRRTPSRMLTHSHDHHQILLVTEGRVTAEINKRIYLAQAPCLILVSSYEPHSFDSEGEGYGRYCVSVSTRTADLTAPMNALLSILTRRTGEFSHVIDVAGREQRFREVCERLTLTHGGERDAYSEFASEVYLWELLLLIREAAPALASSAADGNSPLTWELQRYIETSYGDALTVPGIAARFSISQSKLSHSFRRVTGYSVLEYITLCRMTAARDLLQYSDRTVLDISLEVGYNDVNQFCRSFRQKNGCSPGQYRRRVRQAQE